MLHKHQNEQEQTQCHVLLQSQLSLTSFLEKAVPWNNDLLDHGYHIPPTHEWINQMRNKYKLWREDLWINEVGLKFEEELVDIKLNNR